MHREQAKGTFPRHLIKLFTGVSTGAPGMWTNLLRSLADLFAWFSMLTCSRVGLRDGRDILYL